MAPMAVVERSEAAPGVALLTLNRPAKLNAMTSDLVQSLHEHLDQVAIDPGVRAVILTGAGRGFCAGLDLGGYGTAPHSAHLGRTQAGMATQKHIASLIPKMRSLPQPIIAAVNGPAAGGGLALALGSDVRIAAESARFNVAFVRIGLSGCDIGRNARLRRVLLDKNCKVEPGCVIGDDPHHDRERFPFVTDSGIVIIPKGTLVPARGPFVLANDIAELIGNEPDLLGQLRPGTFVVSTQNRHSYESAAGPRFKKYAGGDVG